LKLARPVVSDAMKRTSTRPEVGLSGQIPDDLDKVVEKVQPILYANRIFLPKVCMSFSAEAKGYLAL